VLRLRHRRGGIVPESKASQRLAGLFLLVLCGGITGATWELTLARWGRDTTGDPCYAVLSVFFPWFALVGLGFLLFPLDRHRLLALHGVTAPRRLTHLPPSWRALYCLGLLGGIANWLALSSL
jgi:hypothetical protein